MWHRGTPLGTPDKVEFFEEAEWEERVAAGQEELRKVGWVKGRKW